MNILTRIGDAIWRRLEPKLDERLDELQEPLSPSSTPGAPKR